MRLEEQSVGFELRNKYLVYMYLVPLPNPRPIHDTLTPLGTVWTFTRTPTLHDTLTSLGTVWTFTKPHTYTRHIDSTWYCVDLYQNPYLTDSTPPPTHTLSLGPVRGCVHLQVL